MKSISAPGSLMHICQTMRALMDSHSKLGPPSYLSVACSFPSVHHMANDQCNEIYTGFLSIFWLTAIFGAASSASLWQTCNHPGTPANTRMHPEQMGVWPCELSKHRHTFLFKFGLHKTVWRQQNPQYDWNICHFHPQVKDWCKKMAQCLVHETVGLHVVFSRSFWLLPLLH